MMDITWARNIDYEFKQILGHIPIESLCVPSNWNFGGLSGLINPIKVMTMLSVTYHLFQMLE